MHSIYTLSKKNKTLKGELTLDGSKSISNRALIIRALSGVEFPIENISSSNDTNTLLSLLSQKKSNYDTGAAGTTFRFMTAYLALQNDTQILTGSARMKERPIGVLVDALRLLGADIDYLEKEGFPPLKINPPKLNSNNKINISANTSSQFISALLMIAPKLPNGLEITLDGNIVSRPYIQMTLELIQYFGVKYSWIENKITIKPQNYQAKDFSVEADWSAASYYYIMAAFADEVDLQLNGLQKQSIQGDAVIAKFMDNFGIQTSFNEKDIHLQKSRNTPKSMFEQDFLDCPDIAQSLAVCCAGLGITGLFSGLETLKIKETDRITALQNELAKVAVYFSPLPPKMSKKSSKKFYLLEGKMELNQIIFSTYKDHRMAMAFAAFAMLGKINIENPSVVEKSYPNFWKDLEHLGFDCKSS